MSNKYIDPFDKPTPTIVVDVDTPEGKQLIKDLESPPEPTEALKDLMNRPMEPFYRDAEGHLCIEADDLFA